MRRNGKGTIWAERPSLRKLEPPVRVVYPREDETIAPDGYTFQISSHESPASVEVSIDQGDWLACREALGLWWLDWQGCDLGEHMLVARTLRADGTIATSQPRIFYVRPG